MNRRYVCLEVWNIDGFLKSSFAKLDLHARKETVKISEKLKKVVAFFWDTVPLETWWCHKMMPSILNLQVNPRTLKLSHTNLQLRWITSIFYFEIHHPERGATCIYTRCSVFFWGGILNCPPHPQTKQKKQLLDISVASIFFAQTPISLYR